MTTARLQLLERPHNGWGAPIVPVELKYVTHTPARAEALDAPATVVLLPGGPGMTAAYLDKAHAPWLMELGYQVVAVDPRGTGRSPRVPAKQLTLAHHVADLEALRQEVEPGRLVLLGHSAGAKLALAYASAYPQHVSALIVVSGAAAAYPLPKMLLARAYSTLFASALAQRKLSSAGLEEAFLRTYFKLSAPYYFAHPSAEWREDFASAFDRPFWTTLTAPGTLNADLNAGLGYLASVATLVVGGVEDRIVPTWAQRALASGIGPAAQLCMLHDCAHFPMWEQPDAYGAAVRRFLAKAAPALPDETRDETYPAVAADGALSRATSEQERPQ